MECASVRGQVAVALFKPLKTRQLSRVLKELRGRTRKYPASPAGQKPSPEVGTCLAWGGRSRREMGSAVMGTRSGHCKVMFKPKVIFQTNSDPMQFGYLQARSSCKEENRLQVLREASGQLI